MLIHGSVMKRRRSSFSLIAIVFALLLTLVTAAPGGAAWIDDSVPAGAWTAAERGDQWLWVSNNPAAFSGALAHQSALVSGIHNHYFSGASTKLTVYAGNTLFTLVYLNPTSPPREIMLLWFDGSTWMHGAYWGENLIPWGVNGTASQRRIGDLPRTGEWVRLEVPAHLVDLEGRTVSGMHFVLYDGQVTWDYSGKTTNGPLPMLSLWPFDTTASEDNDSGGFYLLRSGDKSGELTVYLNIGGTAYNGFDYETIGNPITFAAGQETVQINIQPFNDWERESTETVVLSILPDPTYTLSSTNGGTVTITDNDVTPVVTVAAAPWNASEGAAQPNSPRYGVFTIERTGDQSRSLTVHFALGGTASNGIDYMQITNSTRIIPDAGGDQIFVVPIDDTEIEGTENVVITLLPDPAYIVGITNTASLNILDDDPNNRPTVTIRAEPLNASETDRRYGIFEFERSGGNLNEALTVHFNYEGTATRDIDYESSRPDTYITFPPDAIGVQLYVTPIEDVEIEGTETIVLRLLMPDDGTYRIGSSNVATVLLQDNDHEGLPTVDVYTDDSTTRERHEPPPALPDWGGFRFVRSGGTSAELTVQFTVSGTASNGVDYERITNSITFPAGVFSAGFSIKPLDDALAEGPETVVVTLATNAAYAAGSDRTTVTILDDDGGPPKLLLRRETNGIVDVAVQGEFGRTYRLDASTDLVNWTQVSDDQVMQSYPVVFRDADAPDYPRRFYRVIQVQ
jgi:hypothetical protein